LLLFLAAQAVLHFAFWGDNPRHISSYVYWGPWAEALWNVGVFGLSGGLLALAVAVRLRLPASQNGNLAVVYLAGAAITVAALAVFPTDKTHLPSTPSGYLHDAAALTSVVCLCAAMLLLVECGRVDSRWQAIAGSSTTIPIVATVFSFGWAIMDVTPFEQTSEFLQRVLAAYLIGWFVLVAWRLRAQHLPAEDAPAADAVNQPAR
jgi:hypothetical protein